MLLGDKTHAAPASTYNFLGHPGLTLIESPTPVATLRAWGGDIGHKHLYVKREDLTANGYGGNKVRNMEFILGEAGTRGIKKLITAAPLGSNFVAAMTHHGQRYGFNTEVLHFVPVINRQTTAHHRFSTAQGGTIKIHKGQPYLMAAQAWLRAKARDYRRDTLFVSSGGSSVTGALGHVRAAFELKAQIDARIIPEPAFLILGAGTGGTIAGLTAGFKMLGLKTKIIGVQCVDAVVCNRFAIASLANGVLKRLGYRGAAVKMSDINLHTPFGRNAYGVANRDAVAMSARLEQLEGLILDTTYTSKVAAFVEQFALAEGANQNVLYWHTFSSAAMRPCRPNNAEHSLIQAYCPSSKQKVIPWISAALGHNANF